MAVQLLLHRQPREKYILMSLNLYKAIHRFDEKIGHFLNTYPSRHYKVYKIPKRSIGFRTIAQPTPKVKALQRVLVKQLSIVTKVHRSAFAYRTGLSIKNNAEQHRDSDYLLKVDIKNFFNSLTPEILFKSLLRQGVELSEDDKLILIELAFWNRTKKARGNYVISVGASSSPYISNTIMYNFDVLVSDYCLQNQVNYTRYADDLTFSTKHKDLLPRIYQYIRIALYKEFDGRLVLNEGKTIFSSKANNRHVTGLVLTNSNKISLGRNRKRYISSLVYKFKDDKLEKFDVQHLKGLLAFAKYVEPEFFERLEKKYGKEILDKVKRLQNGDFNE